MSSARPLAQAGARAIDDRARPGSVHCRRWDHLTCPRGIDCHEGECGPFGYADYLGCAVYREHGACLCSTTGHGPCIEPSCEYCFTHHLAAPCTAARHDNRARSVDQGGRLRGGGMGRRLRVGVSRLARDLGRQLERLWRHDSGHRDSADRGRPTHRDTAAGPGRMRGVVTDA